MLQISIKIIFFLYTIVKMTKSNKLSLEQEFKLTLYKQKLNKLEEDNLYNHVINLLKLMMIKDNLIRYFIKNKIY